MARIGIVAGIFIIIVAAIFFGFRRTAKQAEHEAAEATAQERARAMASTPPTATATTASDAGGSAAPTATVKRIDPPTYARLKQQIEQARRRRGESVAAAPGAPDAPKELTKDYIRTQVRELIPMLTECYTKALEDDPELAGKLIVSFAIGGEPEVGGIVETSEIDPESTITHAGMAECVRETMYGAEFVPPPEGGRVTVRYPFEFSN